jgi:long-chain acyl-CoA synthetase
MNLAELAKREIERFGEHVTVIYEGREYTNVQMRRRARRLASALRALGVERGDRVIIQMPNCPEVLQSFGAVYAIGAVVVPINFLVGDEETAFIYRDSGAETVISSMQFWPKIEASRKQAPNIKHIILIDKEVPPGALSYHALVQANEELPEIEETQDDDLAALIYTAGTTGRPKGVMHTHGSLCANGRMQNATHKLPPILTTVNILPLCHIYGIASLIHATLVGGGKIVLVGSFDIDAIFSAIERYRAQIMAAVPTMYIYMLLYPEPEKYDLSSMRYWISGSAPLTLETQSRFKERFGHEIIEGWGLTEAGGNNCCNPFEGKKKIGSVGLPAQGTVMKVVDDQGREVPIGKEGEIIISGPMLMKGYWNKPQETAEVLKDGWLYTGDIGYQDADGYFFITERKKDIIIKGGENIAPREVEEVIFSHPKVSEAAVIGVKDEIYGEDIKACVVLKPGESATETEIISHCEKRLKHFKSPKYVVFLNALPKSLVGKVLKKELRGEKGSAL